MAIHKVKKSPEKSSSWFPGSGHRIEQENHGADLSPPKQNKPGSRLWMRFASSGEYEMLELDRNAIMKRASVSARDLRILGPVSSVSSYILARERIMIVNLEFIKAIVTAEDLFLLDSTSSRVGPFVNNLKQQFPLRSTALPLVPEEEEQKFEEVALSEDIPKLQDDAEEWSLNDAAGEDIPSEFPFEFKVLECALDVVCSYLTAKVAGLEMKAYPILDEFLKSVTSTNLESVRSLKSVLTRLTGRVQKLRDELEGLLNDDDDMAELYLTRKLAQEPTVVASSISNIAKEGPFTAFKTNNGPHFNGATSMVTSVGLVGTGVEVLEMLLEVYFMELDATLNKLTTLREYITDTEDYINIQLDHQRNHLFQFHVLVSVWSLAICVGTGLLGACSMNIPIPMYSNDDVFVPFVIVVVTVCVSIIVGAVLYFHWTGLFEW